jgi:gas vesicle protein
MTTKSKVLLGILGAAAAGVIIGLLVAPEKGKDMRKKIRKTADDWADNLGHLWSRGKEAAEEAAENIKEKVKHAKSSADGKAEKMKESLS